MKIIARFKKTVVIEQEVELKHYDIDATGDVRKFVEANPDLVEAAGRKKLYQVYGLRPSREHHGQVEFDGAWFEEEN